MAKSIRSKVKKRFRTAKRHRVEAMIEKPRLERKHKSLKAQINNEVIEAKNKKNAFLYPNDKESEIPQITIKKPLDFRAEFNEAAGYAFRGNRRKYDEDELENHHSIERNSHPKHEIIAGKGYVKEESMGVNEDGEQVIKITEGNITVNEAAMMLPKNFDSDTKRIPVVKKTGQKQTVRGSVDKKKTKNPAATKKPVVNTTPAKKSNDSAKKTGNNKKMKKK